MKGLFVTATDTGAGKTTLLCRLVPLLEKAGCALHIYKPVESGCSIENGRLVACDATVLAAASCRSPSPDRVCTYRLQSRASPARAAQLEGIELTIRKLVAACTTSVGEGSFLLVEGAGGLYSPIARDGLNADLARHLGLPLLIVVEDRLGCINHALLTLEAARRRRLRVIALVVNQTEPVGNQDTDNFAELKKLTDVTMFRSNHVDVKQPTPTREMATLARHLLDWQK